jgi:hypothetical protein
VSVDDAIRFLASQPAALRGAPYRRPYRAPYRTPYRAPYKVVIELPIDVLSIDSL